MLGKVAVVVLAMAVIPWIAHAQVTDDLGDLAVAPDIIPEDDTVGPVGIVDELMQAHADLTDIMLRQSMGDFDTPDLPFIMTYVDEEKGDLVVVMDSLAAIAGIVYDEEEVQFAIGHDVRIEIQYGELYLDYSSSTQQWIARYKDKCLPMPKPGFIAACAAYENVLRSRGVDPSTIRPDPKRVRTLSTRNPCDVDRDSNACYYYGLYQKRCLPTKTTSRCNTYVTLITSYGYAVPTSAPDPEPTRTGNRFPTNVAASVSGNTITVTWTAPDYAISEYKVYTYKNNWNTDRDYLTDRSFKVVDPDAGTYKFGVKAYYENGAIDGYRDSGIIYSNEVIIPDTIPPVIRAPSTIYVTADDSTGAVVTYRVSARDAVDRGVDVSCSPKSGTKFPVGTTTVVCKASDSSGNEAVATFDVVVTGPVSMDSSAPVISVPDPILKNTTSNGLNVEFTVSVSDDTDETIDVSCSPESGSWFPLGTTTVTCSAEDSAENYAEKSFTVTVINRNNVYAGEKHTYKYKIGLGGTGEAFRVAGSGTIGFTGNNAAGQPGFVGAAHTVQAHAHGNIHHKPAEHLHEYFGLIGTYLSFYPVSTAAPISSYLDHGNVREFDAAFIPITISKHAPSGQLSTKNSLVIDLKHGDSSSMEVGDTIHLFGEPTNSIGTLKYKNATVRLSDSENNYQAHEYTMNNQFIGNYRSIAGDSGAAVVVMDRDVAKIIGIHVGRGCVFTSPSEGLDNWTDYRVTDPVAGTTYCSTDVRQSFTIISPWNAVRAGLGIQ
ncbi:MAG: HYR domain-containing protein [Nitrosopumilus sp.]|nr:HYR domain-containing protein [Nitrosopumilus sp.]